MGHVHLIGVFEFLAVGNVVHVRIAVEQIGFASRAFFEFGGHPPERGDSDAAGQHDDDAVGLECLPSEDPVRAVHEEPFPGLGVLEFCADASGGEDRDAQLAGFFVVFRNGEGAGGLKEAAAEKGKLSTAGIQRPSVRKPVSPSVIPMGNP